MSEPATPVSVTQKLGLFSSRSGPAITRKRPRIDHGVCCYPLAIRKSRIHGLGVFAAGRIPPGRKVIEYTGELVSSREANAREARLVSYLFALNRYWVVDGAIGGSGAECVNHSCNPNLYAWIFRDHVLYMSRRAIEIGKELTIDYRFSPAEVTVSCRCGSRGCRGTINLK